MVPGLRWAPAVLLLVPGCAGGDPAARPAAEPATTSSSAPAARPPTPAAPVRAAATPTLAALAEPSDGQPRRATLDIPALGIEDLVVVPYRGRTDDRPGSAIQDRGRAASPFGPQGGTGPGGVGNYQVTAHRTSSTRAFEFLPDLRTGQRVVVEADGTRYVYKVVETRRTSFRSERSLAEQRAAVPGHPGQAPTRAMITLSTCLTQEDHAAGNWWSDEFDNPEHRADKIGVLVRTLAVAP